MHKPPTFREQSFNCPSCGAFSLMVWKDLVASNGRSTEKTPLATATCLACEGWSLWVDGRYPAPDSRPYIQGKMIYPTPVTLPLPHEMMPDAVRDIYLEAREVFHKSPRAAGALLRLALQSLMPLIGEKGKNINDDVRSLVRQGLPTRVQQMLDTIRVTGNDAVHPGTIDDKDRAEIIESLFGIINTIVVHFIETPAKVEELYQKLPESKRDEIDKRDGKSQGATE